MDKNQIVSSMRNVYVSIAEQLKTDYDLVCWIEHVKNADKFDWNQMYPRVTYEDWIICIYKQDNKLYCIDFGKCMICEVNVVHILPYNDNYEPVAPDGHIVDDNRLHGYRSNDYCGEADDMSCYIYFRLVNEDN